MRYTGPLCRLCRREGKKLFLKGTRCHSQKCGIVRKNYVPGKYGKDQMGKKTEYHNQMRTKQVGKRIFGMSESQFRTFFDRAIRQSGSTGENFLKLLEMRLDNAVFRAGLATSRNQARQIVSHGLLRKNGRRVSIPSMVVKSGDRFEVAPSSRTSPLFLEMPKKKFTTPKWIKVDQTNYAFEIIGAPTVDESERIDTQTIVEFYSR